MKYEQRQIILYNFYWNTKNNQRFTYGNDNKRMGEEIDKIVRDSVLKRASLRSNKQNMQTEFKNGEGDGEQIDDSSSPSSSTFTFSVNTTDNEIDNADLDDARSEYFRAMEKNDKNLTLVTVLSLSATEVRAGLKNLLRERVQRGTKFHLTPDTDNKVIEKLNTAQCIYVVTSFCVSNGVRPDRKYLNNLNREKLLREVKSARDHMKQKKQKKTKIKPITKTPRNNFKLPTQVQTPNESNVNLNDLDPTTASTDNTANTKTTDTNTDNDNNKSKQANSNNMNQMNANKMNTTMTNPTEHDNHTSQKGKQANENKTNGVTKKELAQNLNGANVSNFDTYQPKNHSDLRIPPKPLEDVENDPGHKSMTVERKTQTVHAKLQTGSSQINPPHEVRKLIMQMRKGDPMIQIVPVSDDNSN